MFSIPDVHLTKIEVYQNFVNDTYKVRLIILNTEITCVDVHNMSQHARQHVSREYTTQSTECLMLAMITAKQTQRDYFL